PREHGIILTLEHPPTFTAGRRIRGTVDDEGQRLARVGAEYFETQRGGQTTFHGPGQLVVYPILDLRTFQLGVRDYVDLLQSVAIESCAAFGITAGLRPETGVWIGDAKIAAVGIQVRHHITSHGFALNCNTDLTWFDHIVPCGLPDRTVTSISQE
ncbi:hypothetical protein BDK51DRAFT_14997, partial [Blyttiomyces helicus]